MRWRLRAAQQVRPRCQPIAPDPTDPAARGAGVERGAAELVAAKPLRAGGRALQRQRGRPHGRRPGPDPGRALGLGRRRGRLAERGAGDGRLGAVLVPVGRRSRRRAARRSSSSPRATRSTELDARRPAVERLGDRRAAGSSSSPRRRPPTAAGRAALRRWRRSRSTSTAAPGATPGRRRSASSSATPDGEMLEERGERIGRATNNVAEYRALLLGIELAAAHGADRAGAGRRLGAGRAPGRRPLQGQGRDDARAPRRGEAGARRLRRAGRSATSAASSNADADRLVNAALDGERRPESGSPSRSIPASTSATSTSRSPTSTAPSTSTAACSASS